MNCLVKIFIFMKTSLLQHFIEFTSLEYYHDDITKRTQLRNKGAISLYFPQ